MNSYNEGFCFVNYVVLYAKIDSDRLVNIFYYRKMQNIVTNFCILSKSRCTVQITPLYMDLEYGTSG